MSARSTPLDCKSHKGGVRRATWSAGCDELDTVSAPQLFANAHRDQHLQLRTGFGSLAQTLQQAQARNPGISREEVKTGRRDNSFVPLEPMNQLVSVAP